MKHLSFGFVAVGLVRGDGDFLVEDDIGGLLALADLPAGFGLLLVGAPSAGRVALLVGGGPKGQDVDAAIGVSSKTH
jgi:hypothetical protein